MFGAKAQMFGACTQMFGAADLRSSAIGPEIAFIAEHIHRPRQARPRQDIDGAATSVGDSPQTSQTRAWSTTSSPIAAASTNSAFASSEGPTCRDISVREESHLVAVDLAQLERDLEHPLFEQACAAHVGDGDVEVDEWIHGDAGLLRLACIRASASFVRMPNTNRNAGLSRNHSELESSARRQQAGSSIFKRFLGTSDQSVRR